MLRQTATSKANLVKTDRYTGMTTASRPPERDQMARILLGDDYITAEQMARNYGTSYSDGQLDHFADTLPNMQILNWLHVNGYVLVSGPSTELNLLQVRELDSKLFHSKTRGWYTEGNHEFSTDDMVKAGEWLAIRKEAVPSSFNETWGAQQHFLSEVERVPNVAEASYAVAVYFKVRGVRLLEDECVRTISICGSGGRVDICNKDGLAINTSWEDRPFRGIGVASARKLTLSS